MCARPRVDPLAARRSRAAGSTAAAPVTAPHVSLPPLRVALLPHATGIPSTHCHSYKEVTGPGFPLESQDRQFATRPNKFGTFSAAKKYLDTTEMKTADAAAVASKQAAKTVAEKVVVGQPMATMRWRR